MIPEKQILLLMEENKKLKDELATEKRHYRQLYDKYCALWTANNKKLGIVRLVLAAPFALIAAPFVVIGEGWMKIADWIAGVKKC